MAGLQKTLEAMRAQGPTDQRIYPIPPDPQIGDRGIFKTPPHPQARRSLDFDNMDPDWIYERGKFKSMGENADTIARRKPVK